MIATAPRGRVDADGRVRCPQSWCRRIAAHHFKGEARFRCQRCGVHYWVSTEDTYEERQMPKRERLYPTVKEEHLYQEAKERYGLKDLT